LITSVLHNFSFLLFTFVGGSSARQSWVCDVQSDEMSLGILLGRADKRRKEYADGRAGIRHLLDSAEPS
jgi:hypothetical protein